MQIRFGLAWLKPGKTPKSAFKQPEAHALFDEYTDRIAKFTPCEASGIALAEAGRGAFVREAGCKVWVCDRGPTAKILSSEDVARSLRTTLDAGAKKLWIVIGGADGFTKPDFELLKPDLYWCFGKMTLPHELAAVVASEQIYRAWAILRGLPYHGGH